MSGSDAPRPATRRVFLDQALAAASAVALVELLPPNSAAAGSAGASASAAPNPTPVPGSVLLRPIGEITSANGRLRAVMTVKNRLQVIPVGPNSAQMSPAIQMRYYEGKSLDRNQRWPTAFTGGTPPAVPGPTLRCKLGDKLEIAFLNAVQTSAFQRTLDRVNTGASSIAGCDALRNAGPPAGQTPTPAPTPLANGFTPYPTVYPANDVFPDCLHGSSSANIHFHGTHVTPGTTGDNVLINVRPDANVSEADVVSMFTYLWDRCELGHQPHVWQDLPAKYRHAQEAALVHYDRTAPYFIDGKRVPLPANQRLWPQNQKAIDCGEWPLWYSGSYPYCYQIPPAVVDGKPVDFEMGQAPGTHWYHSHKHGSTAINMFNGLSGAMIIEDPSPNGYDQKLRAFYGFDAHGKPKLQEIVLVFQQLTNVPRLLGGPVGRGFTFVNGQLAPTITMQPAQVQLWRMVNACNANDVDVQFQLVTGAGSSLPTPPSTPPPSPVPGNPPVTFVRTAQDGVQLAWETYSAQLGKTSRTVPLAPANRADVLVQAPTKPGMYVMQSLDPNTGNGPILYINVTGPSIPAMGFPAKRSDWPHRPSWLHDIPSNIPPVAGGTPRNITYGVKSPDPDGTPRTGTGKGKFGIIPEFTINGKQFSENVVDERMKLGATEEWVIINATTGIAHPFHIHINPFQIFEVFDPSLDPTNPKPQPIKPPSPFVWWDTFAIPAGVVTTIDQTDPRTGKVVKTGDVLPGYFKMRTRFVDFAGFYVEHCHILMHEDRGMMQLLEVYDPKAPARCKKFVPLHH